MKNKSFLLFKLIIYCNYALCTSNRKHTMKYENRRAARRDNEQNNYDSESYGRLLAIAINTPHAILNVQPSRGSRQRVVHDSNRMAMTRRASVCLGCFTLRGDVRRCVGAWCASALYAWVARRRRECSEYADEWLRAEIFSQWKRITPTRRPDTHTTLAHIFFLRHAAPHDARKRSEERHHTRNASKYLLSLHMSHITQCHSNLISGVWTQRGQCAYPKDTLKTPLRYRISGGGDWHLGEEQSRAWGICMSSPY